MDKRSYKKRGKETIGKYELVNINSCQPFDKNSRTHSKQQIKELMNSIEEFGFTNPLLVDKSYTIIAGHARWEAAKNLKLTSIPCVVLGDISYEQRCALVIADNKLALNAGWNDEVLKAELSFLKDSGFDLGLTGFHQDELDEMFPPLKEAFTDEDDVPEVTDPLCKLGDVWLLGEHRLMCGDATKRDDIEELLERGNVDFVFTDPPYGINEETDRVFASRTRKCKGNKFNKIIGDDSIETALLSFELLDKLCSSICFWGGNYYAHKLPPSPCWVVWDKRVEDNQKDMNSDCELAYVKHPSKKSVRIFRHLWKGMIKGSEQGKKRIHPTQKPIALAEWCFQELAQDAQTVLDLFGGSGSTLIACEKTNRKCFMMELDPHYCDVIIKRWEQYTGRKAVKEE